MFGSVVRVVRGGASRETRLETMNPGNPGRFWEAGN